MSEIAFKSALRRQHNTSAAPGPPANSIKTLNKAATKWLNRNDKKAHNEKRLAKLRDAKDAEQANRNPALVAKYYRLMLGR